MLDASKHRGHRCFGYFLGLTILSSIMFITHYVARGGKRPVAMMMGVVVCIGVSVTILMKNGDVHDGFRAAPSKTIVKEVSLSLAFFALKILVLLIVLLR